MINSSILLLRSKLKFEETNTPTDTGDVQCTITVRHKDLIRQYSFVILEKYKDDTVAVAQLKYQAELMLTKTLMEAVGKHEANNNSNIQ